MEPQQQNGPNQSITNNPQSFTNLSPAPLHHVTPLSKILAAVLFISLPFVGGYMGYLYAPEKVVEVEKIVVMAEEDKTENTNSALLSDSSTVVFKDGSKLSLNSSDENKPLHNIQISPDEKFVLYQESPKLGPPVYFVYDVKNKLSHAVIFQNDEKLYSQYLDPGNVTAFDVRATNQNIQWGSSGMTMDRLSHYLLVDVKSVNWITSPAYYTLQYKSVDPSTPWIVEPYSPQ